MCAGIGRWKVEVLGNIVKTRRDIVNRYVETLGEINGVQFLPELTGTISNRWLSVMTLNPEKVSVQPHELFDLLEKENIEVRRVWKPMHLQPLYAGARFFTHDDDDIVSERLFNTGICLPSG